MKNFGKQKLDGTKLKTALDEHGLNASKLSVDAGYSPVWLNNGIKRGYVTKPMLIMLAQYGISYDDIKPISEEPARGGEKEENGGAFVRDMTQGDLYETISDAVQDAFRSCKAELQRVIHDAMRDTLNDEVK